MAHSKKITIYDVANRAGVSISTVSNVLNAPSRVSEETRLKVLAAIDELGYVPKAEASARARQRMGRIGVLTPFFTFQSFLQRLRGMAPALEDTPYELVIYPVFSMARLRGYLAMLPITRRLDGLVVMSLPVEEEDVRRLVDNGLETILIEYACPPLSSVVINDKQGGILAARHVIEKNHRRLAFVGNDDLPDYSIHPEDTRLRGFRQVLEANDIELTDEFIRYLNYHEKESNQGIHELLDLPEPPTAVFAATDELAMRILVVARERGLDIPGDLAVIGFDDIDTAQYFGLTTVRQPLEESGRVAIELLLSRLSDPSRPSQSIELPLTLMDRLTV
jgi:DNA-binding LacI/PurR family transcriptional regulator